MLRKTFMKDKNKKEKTEYISLFEAAKKSGYAQDYLSLLCRWEKLKGKKIGRNWVTTYQWLDEYQRNLISDMALKKNSIAPKKDFKEIKNVERITEKARSKVKVFESIKIACSRLLQQCKRARPQRFASEAQRCGRAELILATSLFFLILLSGFTYAKNPQFFSDLAPLEIMSRSLSQLNNNVKKISVSKINLRPEFLTGFAEQVYQAENQIAYRMSEMRENVFNVGKPIAMIPLQVGKKFVKNVITYPIKIPIKIGDGIEKGFEKSDLVLNSSFGKTNLAIQNSFNNFSKGASVFFRTTDREKEFGRVAGVSTEKIPETEAEIKLSSRISESLDLKIQKIIFKIKKNLFKIQDKLGDTYLAMVDYLFPRIVEPENYLLAMPFYKTHKFLPETKSGGEGVVVMPMEGNISSPNNQEIVERLTASFSDEIEVEPEDSGQFGKIKPKNPALPEEEYLYLIVPMKD